MAGFNLITEDKRDGGGFHFELRTFHSHFTRYRPQTVQPAIEGARMLGDPMFKELTPYLRQRAVLLTVTHIECDQIRANVIPQKLKDGEIAALTTPLTVTGTADELDNDPPTTLVNFVSAHLHSRNTLDRAKAEMDAAAKTAHAEARSKAKTTAKKRTAEAGDDYAHRYPKAGAEPVKEEPSKTASLFEAPSAAGDYSDYGD